VRENCKVFGAEFGRKYHDLSCNCDVGADGESKKKQKMNGVPGV
jgi:hypothetical protein